MTGFFDSGFGGMCILEAFLKLCPDEPFVYVADNGHCPYGNKPQAEIIAISERIVRELVEVHGCRVVVAACNTATAQAIDHLRKAFAQVKFVGLEPAVKPAAQKTKTGVVGVLATQGTFKGRLYRETSARFAGGVKVITETADDWVELVERNETEGAEAEAKVRAKVEPLIAAGADQLVLGCTHFPHLKKLIEKAAAGRAEVVDPSDAVAKQIRRLIS